MSIHKLNQYDNIEILGYYDKDNNRIYFSFKHDTEIKDNIYSLFINTKEFYITTNVYLKENNNNPALLEPNIDYYIDRRDVYGTDISIEIIVVNRDITLNDFGEADGVYHYISSNYYKSDSNFYLHKITNNGEYFWEIINDKDVVTHIIRTEEHTTHPTYHNFNEILHKPIINNYKISNTMFNINYGTDYTNYIK